MIYLYISVISYIFLQGVTSHRGTPVYEIEKTSISRRIVDKLWTT